MRSFLFFVLTLFLIFSISSSNAIAQTSAVQKVFNTVKERVDDLVVAKDENNPRELALRIETFIKVIDLSETEAKELKTQLLNLELEDEKLVEWKIIMIGNVNNAINYYQKQRNILSSSTLDLDITYETIKTSAESFKSWRETNYIPTAEEVHNLLVILQEREAIDTAYTRQGKISSDIKKLQASKVRGIEALPILLKEANKFITKADELNKTAYNSFIEIITVPTEENLAENEIATSSEKTITLEEENNNTTTTLSEDVTNDVISSIPSQSSIKDLVRSSLVNIRDAYQVFIEMSNVVRTLFG